MAEIVHVKGLSDLNKFLQELPVKLERNVLRGALRAGVKPIKAAAVAACPVGEPSAEGKRLYGHYKGALRDSIRITTRSKGGRVTASVMAGGKTKKGADVFYAHMIEFTGAVAHVIKAPFWKGVKALFIGGRFLKSVHHPGMRAKPFMRPALDAQAQNAVIASAEYMKKRLATKEGLDTSGVLIEGDT
jgi:HK97 gp10 family phage protein